MTDQKKTSRWYRLWMALPVLVVQACGDGGVSVQQVQGQLHVDGKPAAQALVTFHPTSGAADAPHPTGITDDRGHFRLTSFHESDGAPEGDYAVAITWFRAVPSRDPKEKEYRTLNFLPTRYAEPKTSQLKATVVKGAKELPPLEIKTK